MTLDFADEYPMLPSFRFDTLHEVAQGRGYSQYDTVRFILEQAEGFWVCGSLFYAHYMPSARNRISELREQHTIVSEPCDSPVCHHRRLRNVARYRWVT